MKESFKICSHSLLPGKTMVEYRRGDKLVAAIYPHQDGIRIISKYMSDVVIDPDTPQAAIIELEGC